MAFKHRRPEGSLPKFRRGGRSAGKEFSLSATKQRKYRERRNRLNKISAASRKANRSL